jgi:hypothetical protein
MSDVPKPILSAWRFDRTPILIGVLILPLAATGALGSIGFWFAPDGTIRLGAQASRFVLVERDRRDSSQDSSVAPSEEELESIPSMDDPTPSSLRAVASAAAQRTVTVLIARSQSCSLQRAPAHPASPRAPPIA